MEGDADIQMLIGDNVEALALYERFGWRDFTKNIEIANILKQSGQLDGALYFFGCALRINRDSQHVLLAKLLLEHENGLKIDRNDLEHLEHLSVGYAKFFHATQVAGSISTYEQRVALLRELGAATESFATGSDPDWLYLREVMKLLPSRHQTNTNKDIIPRRLFSYWDKNPPDAIKSNIEYHKSLGFFDVVSADKEIAAELLLSYFGSDTKRLFLSLRHPSEESDFFRCHAVYAYGGYYLDADDQLISIENFKTFALSSASAVYFMTDGGPVRYGSFGSVARSSVLEECIRTTIYNCMYEPNLSMWLKTGPGVITRALVREYNRALFFGEKVPDVLLLPGSQIGNIIRAVKVDYRGDARDWRVYEKGADGN
jgi:hypothetical protein